MTMLNGHWAKWGVVPCSSCGAKTGERCRTASGNIAAITHAARFAAMKEARKRAERVGGATNYIARPDCDRCGAPYYRHAGDFRFCPFYSTYRAASADTLPEGQDAQQGLAGTESGAVPEGQTPSPSSSPAAGR